MSYATIAVSCVMIFLSLLGLYAVFTKRDKFKLKPGIIGWLLALAFSSSCMMVGIDGVQPLPDPIFALTAIIGFKCLGAIAVSVSKIESTV